MGKLWSCWCPGVHFQVSRWLKRRVLYPIISLTVSNIESADQWGRYSMLGESYHIHGADEVDTDYDLTHGRIWVFRQHCIAVKHSFHLTFFSFSGRCNMFHLMPSPKSKCEIVGTQFQGNCLSTRSHFSWIHCDFKQLGCSECFSSDAETLFYTF